MTNAPDTGAPAPRRGLPRAVRIAVSLALLGWLVTRIPPAHLADTARTLRLGPVLVALAAILLGQVLRAVRTCALLRDGVRLADIPPMLRMQMLAFLPGMLSPAKAGELLKVELWRREWDISLARGGAAFFAERLADVAVLGACALWGLAGVFGQTIPRAGYIAAATIVLCLVVGTGAWRAGIAPAGWRDRARDALAQVRWIPFVGASIAYWVLVAGIVWLFARATHSSVPFPVMLGTVPLALLTALAPISFGGFGVREGAMVLLFQQAAVGCTEAQAVAIALLYDVLGLGVPALMGIGYMLARPRHG